MSDQNQIPDFEDFKAKRTSEIPDFEDFKKSQGGSSYPAPPSPSLGEQVGTAAKVFGGEMLRNLNPVNAVRGLGQLVQHPIDTLTSGMAENRAKNAEDLKKGNYTDAFIHGMGGIIPVLGPMYARGMDAVSANDPEEGGKSLADITSLKAAPKVYEGLGHVLGAAAPKIAETAMHIRKADKAFGRTPGESIINETSGVRPETVAASANTKLGSLNPELNKVVANSNEVANLQPARDVIGSAKSKALKQNSATIHGQLDPLETHLSTDLATGQPIPSFVTPSRLLDLKRGFGEEHTRWNPETNPTVNNVGRQAYRALDSELDRTVPEAAGLNQRISSLIPVAKRAESTARNADVGQRILGRLAAHTGALTGGVAGYHYGGIPGAIAGTAVPELLSSPTAQMVAARSANAAGGLLRNPVTKTAATTGALTGKRKREEQDQ